MVALDAYKDSALISEFPHCAERTDWAKALWSFGKELIKNKKDLVNFTLSFIGIAQKFSELPVWRRVETASGYGLLVTGLSYTDRINLLLEWWSVTRRAEFAKIAVTIAENPIYGLDSWRDGEEAIELICKLRDGDYFEEFPELSEKLEASYIRMLERHISSDDLENISDAIENWRRYLSNELLEAFSNTVRQEFDDIKETVSEVDSESTLQDHIGILKKLGKRNQFSPQDIEKADESGWK